MRLKDQSLPPYFTVATQGSDGGDSLPLYQWHLPGTHWCLVDEHMVTVGTPWQVLQSVSVEVGRGAEVGEHSDGVVKGDQEMLRSR